MPICENKNKGTSISVSGDIDHHHAADAAKVMKSREQAYFNSYDFDAIEELPYEENNAVIHNEKKLSSGKKQVSAAASASAAATTAESSLDLGALSNAYLKRLTSYFTIPNRTRQSIKTRSNNNIVDVECDGQSRSERSNSSSSSSAGSSRTLYSSHKMGGNAVTTQKGLNNFLLPRAMLKYQSAIATNPMPVSGTINNANTSSINKVNSITCINGSGTNGGNNRQLQKIASGTSDSGFGGVVVHGSNGYEKNGHERVISSSHYSTEKSGSSGYYSSNLCSTSSVEEHIYSEPVIDVLEQRGIPTLLKVSLPIKTTTKILSGKLQQDDDHDDDIICGESHCDINNVIITTSTTNTKTLLTKTGPTTIKSNEDLRTLETSIENLDRHLKSYPKFVVVGQQHHHPTQLHQLQQHHHHHHHQRTTSFIQCTDEQCLQEFENSKRRQLPTIMEGIDNNPSPLKTDNTWSDDMDDSLMDIDLDSFLLANEMAKKANKVTNMKGIDNPNFNKTEVLNDEALENNYKCSKYVNSCPEDAYNVESVIEGVDTDLPDKSLAFFLKKYEDQLHFQSTKDMLEDIRERLRILILAAANSNEDHILPNDLEKNIATLKQELETYLIIMNRNSEMEIKQFCAGLTNNQKLVTITKAFERRKSLTSDPDYEIDYEPIRAVTICGDSVNQYNLESITPDIGSVKCSDPNFKLKRKSITEIFPLNERVGGGGGGGCGGGGGGSVCTIDAASGGSIEDNCVMGRFNDQLFDEERSSAEGASAKNILNVTQLQRNLSYQRPKLDRSDMKKSSKSEDGKNSILEWHRNRPSIWELYYGTNRLNQTLSGKKGQLVKNTTSVMSYPSSRPESDFTLDLPRAEQLRLKMEKEKKFRHRCRILTTFLSLVFFLLTVMIVSLVLTRGKRMFGSML